jgi:hypothetical protein
VQTILRVLERLVSLETNLLQDQGPADQVILLMADTNVRTVFASSLLNSLNAK